MRKISLTILSIFMFVAANSQGLSYNCPRLIQLGCGQTCINVTATFPDIKSSTANYTYKRVQPSGCLPYIDPSTPGPSANLTIDDRYSTVITMPFSFKFFNDTYNQLVASTNGYVSFDVSLATTFSHWQNRGILPNSAYDPALIMGPYHDLYPQPPASSTSPTQQVKYEVIGSAPNRKWILSFYKLPLFDCEDLIENTHQIVLHETTGIVEVYIKDMQICNTWPTTNPGRSMLGMQNMARNKAVMVAGHTMNDAPWGSIGMDEFWRFIPSEGSILYSKVELVDAGGGVVAVGDTTRIDANTFSTTFSNICPPENATTTYFVKTTYRDPNNPGSFFYSMDEVSLERFNHLPLSGTSTPTNCGASTGTITATASGGTAPYQYSIDLGPLQGSGTFTGLPQGPHTIIGVDAAGCTDTITVNVGVIPNIPGSATTTATGCPGVNNGTFTVTPTGGSAPYTYSMDGGPSQSSNVFTNVGAGAHTVIFTDVNGCSGTVTKTVNAGASITSTATTAGTSCNGASDGSVTITATSGTGPYTYAIDGGTFGSTNVFTGLPSGAHTISIRDASGCTGTKNVNISAGAGLSISLTSTPTFCPGTNTGTIIVTHNNGTPPYTYTVGGNPAGSTNPIPGMSSGIKTVSVKDANGCTGTGTVAISNGSGITGNATAAPAGCSPGGGSVTLNATTGTAPYTYSLDGGAFQSSNVFTGVAAGNHTGIIKDANGCTVTLSANVSGGSSISGTATSTPTACPGVNNGSVTVTATAGTAPYQYSIDGTTFQASNVFTNVGAGPQTITLKDANGCSGTVNVTVPSGTTITGTATQTPAACAAASNGTVTVTPTSGSTPYQYSIDGGTTFQASNTFSGLTPGAYTVTIKDASGCTGTVNITVTAGAGVSATATSTPTACPGVNNGSVTVTASAGTAPYQYSIDGTTFQASNVFTNVGAGPQTITLKDANGCSGTVNVTVPAGTTITGTATQTPAACAAASNGTVTVTPTSGSTPYQYSIDGGTTFQASSTFSGLTPGAYTVTIKDASGCTGTVNITVTAGAGVSATATSTPTACPGVNNGSVTVTATAGTAPYQYSIDGTTFQASNVFTNVGAGAQTITVKDANGCSKVVNVTVAAGTTITSTATQTPAACAAASNGTVTVTPTSGSTPYQYSIDGGTTFQASSTFSGLTPGAYTVTIKDASGCTGTVNITVTAGAGVSATATSTPTACPGVNNGSVTVTATAGTAPYQYSIDGTTFQASNVFTNVGAGAQTITVKDVNGCSKVVNVTVAAGTTITSTATQTSSSCPVAADGSLTVTPSSGTSPYQYSIDGGTTFQASNTFSNILSGPYTITIKDASGCTGTVNITVTAGVGITGTATSTPSTCAVAPNASITATATSGVAPYTYSIDGTTFQASNTFNNILSGSYTVTFKDNLGCTGTTSVTVSTGTGLTGTGTSAATSCPTVNNGSITITPTTGNAPYTYSLDGGASQSSATFTNISSGSHTVIFTDALGCTGQVTINVASGASVTATATPVKTSCPTSADGSVTVVPNNGTAPYQFSIDGSAATQPTGVFSGLAVGPHSVTFTDANGCSGVVNFNIQAGPVITGTASATGASCPGISNGTITVTATSGLPPYKYSLDGGSPQTSNTFNGVSSGSHTVVITDALACNTATINVSVSAGTAITGTATPTPTTCPGVNNGKITVTPSTGTAPYQYSIDGGITYQSSNEFTNLATGSYTITFNDANGCPATVTANVTEGAGLVVTATSVATSCPGVNNGTLTVSPTTGTAPYTYTLSGRPSQPSATFTNLATGTYTIQVKDALGCTGSVTETVDEGVNLTSTLDLTQPVCFGINDGIIKINATSGTAPYTYTVSGLPSQASSTFNNLPPDNYTITIKDAVGCTGTNSATLVSNPEIVLTPSKTDPLCFGSADGIINIATAGGVSPYTYAISGGSGPQATNEFTGLTVGSYTIVVKDNLGCQKSVNVSLAQPTKLIASATSPAPSTCLGGDGEITVAATGGTSPYTYSIDNGTSYPFQTSPTFTVATGTYSNVAVKDANGCNAGTSVFVNVIDNMFLSVGNDTTICQGAPVTFNVLTNAETNVFRWRDTVALNDANIKNATATPKDTITYILHAEWGACSREDTITINVKLLPIPEAGPEQMICLNDSTIISGSVSHTSGTVNYAWSPAQYVRNPNLQTTRAVAPATQTYVLTVTDNYGCNFSVSDSVKVIMQPTVPAYAGGDTLAAINKPHVLVGSGGVQYHWTPLSSGVRIDNPNLQYPTVYLSNDANFMVKVTDIAGCVGYDSVYVQVYEGPEYYIPNAFTPNGDGLNDIFRPLPVKMTRQEYFRIFNRFGELVFETNQYMKGWDGTYKGKPQPTGVYVWILKGFDAKGMKVEMKGTITIVR